MKYLIKLTMCGLLASNYCLADSSSSEQLRTLSRMQAGDTDMEAAAQAAKSLQIDAPEDVLSTLKSMKSATPIGKNWLASIAASQYQTAISNGKFESLFPSLDSFLSDQSNDSEARTLVFHWLTDAKPEMKEERLRTMINDDSPELRFAAIQQSLDEIEKGDSDSSTLERLLEYARHADQVRSIIKKLNGSGKAINQAEHFGFLLKWHLVGPFDNRGQKHFDTVYPVEADLLADKFDPTAKFEGKDGAEVSWQLHRTDDDEGMVNLANIYSREKGAVVYGYTTLVVDQAEKAQMRLTSINANKAWLNGKEVIANNVYHAGTRLDQYIADIDLKQGTNTVVLKILQNEQTEGWAQDYQFHCRITDRTGKAVKFSVPE